MTKYLVTAALPYANGPIHLGHIAGAYLPADIYVRYMKLKGEDVIFICGSDNHGVPITLKAEEEGKTPQEIVDFYHDMMDDSFKKFGIVFDNFSKTSAPVHHKNASDIFLKLYENGYFIKKTEKQYYCSKCERYLPDRYVEGICPHCDAEGARGDQCDVCGKVIDNVSLKNPVCKICGSEPKPRETEHLYLDLSMFQDKLKQWLETKTEWKANVREFALGWIKEGLKPRAMTRDLSWGVKVPVEGFENKVLYVWFDAPIGYISSTIEWAEKIGDKDRWKDYWKNRGTRLIHFLGKDNVVFHAVIWPAILMGIDDGYVLPYDIPANEYLNIEGKKFSTSKRIAIWLNDYLKDFPPDIMRYVLAASLPESKDSDFSWKEFQAKNNSELADIYGNFVNRTLTFISKFSDNKVEADVSLNEADKEFLNLLKTKTETVGSLIEHYQLRKATAEFMDIARESNKYFTVMEPWKLKNDRERLNAVLHVCFRAVCTLAYVSEPFIPFTSENMKNYLGLKQAAWGEIHLAEMPEKLPDEQMPIMFTKIEDKEIDAQILKLAGHEPEDKEQIEIDDFFKAKLVVARILKAEKLPKADKLLKLEIDPGTGPRTIIAGIARHYKPEDIIGKNIAVVRNLKPAKIRGIESKGMLLAASNKDKTELKLLIVDDSMKPGDRIG